jgi:hypothetical protein
MLKNKKIYHHLKAKNEIKLYLNYPIPYYTIFINSLILFMN